MDEKENNKFNSIIDRNNHNKNYNNINLDPVVTDEVIEYAKLISIKAYGRFILK